MPEREASDGKISDWVRSFAETNYHLFTPSLEQLLQTIAAYFPSQLSEYRKNSDGQELLENILGIVTIIKLGNEYIAWSVTSDRAEAEARQQAYSTPSYSSLRHELGVDAHWILLIDPDFFFTLQDLYEAHMNLLELVNRPECVVVPV